MGGRLGGEGVRSIDDAVARRVDRNGDGEFSGTKADNFFYLTDVMFSVRAIVDGSGLLHTRLDYTPYGVAMHGFAADVNGDGVVNYFDLTAFDAVYNAGTALRPGATGYDPDADLSGSGSMDSDDSAAFAARYSAYAPGGSNPTFNFGGAGWIDNPSDPNGPGNSVGYDGYWFDLAGATEATSSGLYMVRRRVYDPRLGRWLERDPIGYVDGMNLYQYTNSSPVVSLDPTGLSGWKPKLVHGPRWDSQVKEEPVTRKRHLWLHSTASARDDSLHVDTQLQSIDTEKWNELIFDRDPPMAPREFTHFKDLAFIPNEVKFVCRVERTVYSNGVKAVRPVVHALPQRLSADKTTRSYVSPSGLKWVFSSTVSWYLYQQWDATRPSPTFQVDVSAGGGYSYSRSAQITVTADKSGLGISSVVEVSSASHAKTDLSHPSWIWECVCDRTGESWSSSANP